jgi:hypothetical protein
MQHSARRGGDGNIITVERARNKGAKTASERTDDGNPLRHLRVENVRDQNHEGGYSEVDQEWNKIPPSARLPCSLRDKFVEISRSTGS